MGLIIIFSLVTLLAVWGTLSALKNKNFLGLFFAAATAVTFGWFTIMTVLKSGFPAA